MSGEYVPQVGDLVQLPWWSDESWVEVLHVDADGIRGRYHNGWYDTYPLSDDWVKVELAPEAPGCVAGGTSASDVRLADQVVVCDDIVGRLAGRLSDDGDVTVSGKLACDVRDAVAEIKALRSDVADLWRMVRSADGLVERCRADIDARDIEIERLKALLELRDAELTLVANERALAESREAREG